MTTHPERDDDRGPHSDELIWWHGRLVERDHPDVQDERRARAARRCMIDYPFDLDEEEDDSQA